MNIFILHYATFKVTLTKCIYTMCEEPCHMMKSNAFKKSREYIIVAVKQFKVLMRGTTRFNGRRKTERQFSAPSKKNFSKYKNQTKQRNGITHKTLSCPFLKAFKNKLDNHLLEIPQILHWVSTGARQSLRFPFIHVFKYLITC